MRRRLLGAALAVLCASAATADDGRVRLHRDAGPFTVTVFTAPEPLTAGPADVSVLVQDRVSGEALFDARVEIELHPPGAVRGRITAAVPGANRLFQAAVVELATPGDWGLGVAVSRAGATGQVSCVLPVGAPASRLPAIWPFLAAPPLGVALYAIGGALRRRSK